jgi:ParB family transcriptional regulator, chromosome partitioning protein
VGIRGQDGDEGADLPEKLLTEHTAYHSLGLRNGLADIHTIAYLAVLNALSGLCGQQLPANLGQGQFRHSLSGASRIRGGTPDRGASFGFREIAAKDEAKLWDVLLKLQAKTQDALYAHCAGLTVKPVRASFGGSSKRRHALQLAGAVSLDMREQGFVANVANYCERITKL